MCHCVLSPKNSFLDVLERKIRHERPVYSHVHRRVITSGQLMQAEMLKMELEVNLSQCESDARRKCKCEETHNE